MRKLLVPDLSATVDVDPELARMDDELRMLHSSVDSVQGEERRAEIERIVADAQSSRGEYASGDGWRPQVTIGYMPGAVRTRLRNAALASRTADNDVEHELERGAYIDRETVRYGLRGWNLTDEHKAEIECSMGTDEVAGVRVPVASHEAVAIIEAMGWLRGVAYEIHRYNQLDDEQKKRS
jgi:hypothetical protein